MGARVRSFASLLALAIAAASSAQRFEPFVPIGVWYDGLSLPSSVVLHDLQAIRSVGFNHIKVPVPWAAIEPERGQFAFDRLDQLLTLAAESGLKVLVQPDPGAGPPWVDARAPDVRALGAFADAVTSRAAAHPSFLARDARLQTFRVAVPPDTGTSASIARRVWRLDAIRTAAGEHGWMAELEVSEAATAADVRQWGWAALAHGARGVTFVSWYAQPPAIGLAGRDGTITDRARAAGEFAGVVAPNAALFAPLRPRPSAIALVYNPFWSLAHIGAETIAWQALLGSYERMFERNLQADVISSADLAAGAVSPYAAALVPAAAMLPPHVRDALRPAMEGGERMLAAPRTALPTAQGLEPDVRIEGGEGLVEARFLQSADAITLLALNYADAPQAVTLHFAAGTPEAIWQNMETGASVSFVQSAAGLTYRHTFSPRATLVLSIRTRLR